MKLTFDRFEGEAGDTGFSRSRAGSLLQHVRHRALSSYQPLLFRLRDTSVCHRRSQGCRTRTIGRSLLHNTNRGYCYSPLGPKNVAYPH